MQIITNIIAWAQGHASVLLPVYMGIEFILGKTTFVKAGSVLELILNGIKKGLEMVGVKETPVIQ